MNKSLEIKICGIGESHALDAVINGGADHFGLIFFEKSPRNVSLDKARSLKAHAAGRISAVAVTVDASDERLDAIVDAARPEMLQLHGSESPQRAAQVRKRYGLPVMKALAIREAADLDRISGYLGIADRFLFDAKPPEGSQIPGGNGVAFDWEIMDHLPENVPYMLSGGLDAGNLREAIAKSGATAIDVSSGVESAPGKKDVEMIRHFLIAAGKR